MKMVDEESQSDLVKEARGRLSQITRGPFDVYPVNTVAGDTVGFRWGKYLSEQRDADHFWNSECVSFEEATFYASVDGLVSALCDEVEELRRRNSTQEQSITHLQSQQRVMKEAIEGALTWIEKFKTLDHNAFHAFNQGFEWEKCNERTCQKAFALVEQLRSAITPKGSEQQGQ